MIAAYKTIMMPDSIKEGFENPVVASVMPTLSMGIILLSTYIKPYASSSICHMAVGLDSALFG